MNSSSPSSTRSPTPNSRPAPREADQDLLKSLIVFACIMEGIFFYVGFVQILALGRQNKMTGAAEQYQYILRDESMHCNFGIDLINTIKLENPHLWTSEFKAEIRGLIQKGVELEYRYAEDTMPRGVLGLNASPVQGIPALHRQPPLPADRPRRNVPRRHQPLPLDGRDDRPEEGEELLRDARHGVSDGRGVELGLTGWDRKKAQGTAPFLVGVFRSARMNDPVAILNWFTEKWHKPYTAIGIFLLGLAGTFYIWPEIESRTVSISQVVISFVVGLSLLGFWVYTHRVPKIKPGNLGFTIAITGETENERAVVSSDFVSASKEVLEGLGKNPAFQIIELSRYHAEKIIDVEAAQKYREKSGSNFLLFGTAKRRPVKGKDHYVLKLRGLVTHAPIPIEKSELLAQEMHKVLPLEFRVACEDSLDGFEVNSLWFAESAKFVIASAALLSGDFLLAKRLLENLKQSGGRLNKHKKKPGIKALLLLVAQEACQYLFRTVSATPLSMEGDQRLISSRRNEKLCRSF